MTFDLDIAIVVSFLVITLAVAFSYGKGVKTIGDYALGGRNFSTTTLVSTIVATWVSGSGFVITLSNTYSDGLSYLIASCSMSVSMVIIAVVFIPRMGEFLGKLSVAEVMGDLYGKEVRFITAICGILGQIGGIAVQFKVYSTLFYYLFGINAEYALYLASIIVILYSAFGGIRAVTYTDVLQFFTFSFIIPVIGIIIWFQITSYEPSKILAANKLFDYKYVLSFDNPDLLGMVFLMIYFAFPCLAAEDFQRISMGKNIAQVKKAFFIAAILVIAIEFFTAWIPFLVLNIRQDLEPNNLFGYIINTYTYTGLKGLVVIGVSAMSMSTADSRINAATVLFSHDIGKIFNVKINKLIISKIFAFVLGGAALYLATSKDDLLSIVMISASFYMPIVSIPLVMSILGFRSSKQSVLISMSGGFVTVLLWDYLNIDLDNIIPGMAVNFILLISSHYILKQKGGFVGIKDRTIIDKTRRGRKLFLSSVLRSFKEFNFTKFCLNNSPKNEAVYSLFGIFCFVSTIATIYLSKNQQLLLHKNILLFIYQSMMVISTFFLLYMVWSPSIRNKLFVGIVWNFTLVYILTFCSSLFVLLSDFGNIQLLIFALNMMVMFILTRWSLAIIMGFIGISCSIQFYKYYAQVSSIDILLKHDIANMTIYIFLLGATALITIIKPKQEQLKIAENTVSFLDKEVNHLGNEVHSLGDQVTNLSHKVIHYSERVQLQEKEIVRLSKTAETILNNVNHNLRLPIGNVINFAEMLKSGLEKYGKNHLKMLTEEVCKNSNKLSTMILNMLDLAMLQVRKIQLETTTINFSELVISRIKACKSIYLEDKNLRFKLDIEPEILIVVDPNYMRQTIDNLVINSIKYSEKGVISIKLRKAKNYIEFSISDQGIGIPETDLVTIFEPFIVSSKTETPAGNRGVGLSLCKSAVVAHKGEIKAASNGVVGASFSFKLPIVTNT